MTLILIVEDEEQVRVLAESYLHEHGHRTLTASTRDEALALLDVADGITVLFTDLGLHGELDVPEGPNERDDRRLPLVRL
jgi:CheY-like chemotaxis protein